MLLGVHVYQSLQFYEYLFILRFKNGLKLNFMSFF